MIHHEVDDLVRLSLRLRGSIATALEVPRRSDLAGSLVLRAVREVEPQHFPKTSIEEVDVRAI